MSSRLAQTVIDVLSFSRQGDNPMDYFERFSEREWQRGLSWLDWGGVSLYFWRQVRQMGLQSALPPAIRARFEHRQAQNLGRTSAMVQEWKKIQDLFSSSGVRCVVLKGLAMIPDYCPDPSLRVQFDHDCLIDRDSLGRVEELLRSAGYHRKKLRERDRVVYAPDVPASCGFSDSSSLFSAAIQRPVELHLELWDSGEEKVQLQLPEDLMARSTTRTWVGIAFAALSEEDALLFEALHTFRHVVHNWCRLSVLFEIEHFLDRRRSDGPFWRQFCARIENDFRLRRIADVVFALAASLFRVSFPCPDIPSTYFGLTPELQLWVNRYGRKSALGNFSTNKFSLFLLREFVEDQASWREVRRRRLFPVQIPHRLRAADEKRASAKLVASCRQGFRIIRRFWFHMREALLYAWEYPRWRVLIRREGETRVSAFRTEAPQREGGRTSVSTAKSSL
jgi:hypothetical protein